MRVAGYTELPYYKLSAILKIADSQNTESVTQSILQAADRCVACGMCLPVCPSYQIAKQEAESPRGRLSLIQAYLNGAIEDSELLHEHLNHCLLCRSCEKICPAKVPFASVMDRTQVRLSATKKISFKKKLLLKCVENYRYLLLSERALRVSGLNWLFGKIGFGALFRYATRLSKPVTLKEYYPATGQSHSTVALFIGCVQPFFDAQSLGLTIRVLNQLGVNVHIPLQQACCGAMHLHSGKEKTSNQLLLKNKQAFSECSVDANISLSSACTVSLQESVIDEMPAFIDLCTYLNQIKWYKHADLVAVNVSVLLHIPCTQRNILNNIKDLQDVLLQIPGLKMTEISAGCCGAAGTYMLDYPDWSQQIKSALIKDIDLTQYDCLVTSNIGCQLQLESDQLAVMQPVTLIARALSIMKD